jgi:hypothetical protein
MDEYLNFWIYGSSLNNNGNGLGCGLSNSGIIPESYFIKGNGTSNGYLNGNGYGDGFGDMTRIYRKGKGYSSILKESIRLKYNG